MLNAPTVVVDVWPALAAGAPSGDGGAALRVLIGVGVLVTLALLASSRLFWSYRRSPVGAMITTGGWAAVLIGLALGPGAIGLVSESHVDVLRPLILFCLGWVGLMVGLQLRRDLPKLLPAGVGRWAMYDFVASVLLFGAVVMGVLALIGQVVPLAPAVVVALVLAVSAIGWSPEVRSVGGGRLKLAEAATLLRAASSLGGVAALATYGLLSMAVQHGERVALTPVMLALGVGSAVAIAGLLGAVGRWLIAIAGRSDAAFLVVLLGLVTFAAGTASTMGFSPLFVSMLLGAVIANMPGKMLSRFQRVIVDAEQPIAMALMLTAGVVADPTPGRTAVWLVVVLFAARLVVKRLLARWQPFRLAGAKGTPMVFGPIRQAPIAVALALSYAISAHADTAAAIVTGGEVVTIVIAVGLLSDLLPLITRFTHPRRWARAGADDAADGGAGAQAETEPAS